MHLFTEKQAKALVKLGKQEAAVTGEKSTHVARRSRVNPTQWLVICTASDHYVEYDDRFIQALLDVHA